MTYATDGQLPRDTNGEPAEGVYSPNTGTVAQQAGTVTVDKGGQPSAPTLAQIGDATIPTQAVNVQPANTPPTLLSQAAVVALSPNNTGLPVNLANILQKAVNVSSGAVASLAKAFTGLNGQGNSIVVLCAVGNGTAATVTDSAGNTYNAVNNAANSTTFAAQIFWATNIAGGSSLNTVTVTPSASVSVGMEIYEVPGLLALANVQPDQSATNTGTGTSATTSAITPTVSNEYLFGAVAVGTAAQTVTPASGWTNDSGQQNVGGTPSGLFSFVAMSQFRAGLAPVTPSATLAGSEPWAMAVASFRPVALPVEGKVNLAIGGTAASTPADSLALTNTLPSAQMQQSGTALASPRRMITKFVQLQALSITHATPADVYTPTSGKKWRVLGYNLSTTVAGAIQLEDTTGVEFLRTPLLLAAAPFASGDMGNGYLSSAANNHLFLDVTVTGAVTGWIGIMEE